MSANELKATKFRIQFLPGNTIKYFQDHQFPSGLPSDVIFDVVTMLSEDSVKLCGPGYGGDSYGNGAVHVNLSELLEKADQWIKFEARSQQVIVPVGETYIHLTFRSVDTIVAIVTMLYNSILYHTALGIKGGGRARLLVLLIAGEEICNQDICIEHVTIVGNISTKVYQFLDPREYPIQISELRKVIAEARTRMSHEDAITMAG
jgi:hypothetical protein